MKVIAIHTYQIENEMMTFPSLNLPVFPLEACSIMLLCCGSNTVILWLCGLLIQTQNNVPQDKKVMLVTSFPVKFAGCFIH